MFIHMMLQSRFDACSDSIVGDVLLLDYKIMV